MQQRGMPSHRVVLIADQIAALTLGELAWLRAWLRRLDGEGGGGSGVREPRRPQSPLDARGVALDSEQGKADTRP